MVTGKPGLKKLVYAFSEGDASMTDLLGGKGSNLCEMFRLGFLSLPALSYPPKPAWNTSTLVTGCQMGLPTAFAAVLGRLKRR